MPSQERRRDPHPPFRWALLLIAFACLLLSASILTASLAAPPAGAHPNPGASLSGTPRAQVSYHPEQSPPYTAQGLTAARWEVGAIQANWNHRALWEAPVTGDGTRVAIIDTGVDPDHPDLRERVVAWRDFVNDRPDPYDDTGHGTHVAGIIAAGGHTQLRPDQGYFLTGARGMAPDVEILAAKAMDADGRGDPGRIAQAIEWALDPEGEDPAHVINLSLGIALPSSGDEDDRSLADHDLFPETGSMKKVRDAVEKATAQGVVVVVAAGNHEPGEDHRILFPGTMDEVITVGAVDPSGRVAAFSNTGRPGEGKPDIVAPGVIVSTSPRIDGSEPIARYRGLGGTSMAAPFVTGTIALMMEADPTLRAGPHMDDPAGNTERVREILRDTARPHPDYGSSEQGAGILRVDEALVATGTGDAELRPALYATPAMLVVGGTWIAYRRRGRNGGPPHSGRTRHGRSGGGRSGDTRPGYLIPGAGPSTGASRTGRYQPGPEGPPGPRQPISHGFDHGESPLPMEGPHGPTPPAPPKPHTYPQSDPFAPAPSTPVRPRALPGSLSDRRPQPHENRSMDPERRRPRDRLRDPGVEPRAHARRTARRPMQRPGQESRARSDPIPPWSLKARRNPDPAQAPDEDNSGSGPRRRWRRLIWD